jgi:hypothetical protein
MQAASCYFQTPAFGHFNARAPTRPMPRDHEVLMPKETGQIMDGVPASVSRTQPPELAPSDFFEDWDVLFGAVKDRLNKAANTGAASTAEPLPHDAAERMRAVMLECVEALGQLHTMLVLELERRGLSERPLKRERMTQP